MKTLFFMLAGNILLSGIHAQGIFNESADIGNPTLTGSTSYDPSVQQYTLKGAGYNIWFERDEFHYAYNKIKGDFILTANFEFVGKGVDPHRKMGWMIRESDDANAAHASATLHGDGLTALQWRELKGAYMRNPQDQQIAIKSDYSILQLERKGNSIVMRAAHRGEPLQLIGVKEMNDLPEEVLAGLFICSHNSAVIEEARIWNVRIDLPLPETYNAYEQGLLAARLETMNVFTGERRIIYENEKGFEAPNWPSENKLLFNQEGRIYTIAPTGGEPDLLNTGKVVQSNNDHVVSWNGKHLAISSGSEGYSSRIYILPIEGGEPRLITPLAPSYLHGWSLDNKYLVYTAQRNDGPYNIFSIRIADGKEEQLTFNDGLSDGPEYSPDGKYLYYNGTQTGTMQLWRMRPDGSNPEQLTFDACNNWFPHVSPDNKWIVYVSFGTEVPPAEHPHYQRVELKMMPVAGGAPRTIAYLYGGQGTINVPSWSPDSKHIAFVSYRGR